MSLLVKSILEIIMQIVNFSFMSFWCIKCNIKFDDFMQNLSSDYFTAAKFTETIKFHLHDIKTKKNRKIKKNLLQFNSTVCVSAAIRYLRTAATSVYIVNWTQLQPIRMNRNTIWLHVAFKSIYSKWNHIVMSSSMHRRAHKKWWKKTYIYCPSIQRFWSSEYTLQKRVLQKTMHEWCSIVGLCFVNADVKRLNMAQKHSK